jgi:hypothetical protein
MTNHPTPEDIQNKLIYEVPTPVVEVSVHYRNVLTALEAAEKKLAEIKEIVGNIEINDPAKEIIYKLARLMEKLR